MLEVKITIEARELASAINNLAKSLGVHNCKTVEKLIPVKAEAEKPVEAAEDPAVSSTNGAGLDMLTEAEANKVVVESVAAEIEKPAPVPAAPQPEPVPEPKPKKYTLEQISNAGAKLVDAGKMPQIMALIQKYGVQAINQLNPAVYGNFAEDLMALGAKFE